LRAGRYDITIEQGAGFSLPITYKPGGQTADLTGSTARLQVRPKVGSSEKLIELTTTNGGITLDGPAGKLTLVMSAAATAALKFARAVYDLEVVPPAAEPYRLLEGNVFLSREVTR
jgi:hypothetical protein